MYSNNTTLLQQDKSLATIAAHFASPVRSEIVKTLLTNNHGVTLNALSAAGLADEQEMIRQLSILEDADLIYTTTQKDHIAYHLNELTFNQMLNDFLTFFSDITH